jgi:4-hydroxybenzoate polyprenyltransferase
MSDVGERLSAFAPSDQSFFGYLFWLSRPRFWLYLAGPVAVGVVYAADSVAGFFQPLALALFAWFLVPANVFLYGVNDIFDSDVDADNPKKGEEGREVRYTGDGIVVMVVYLAGAVGTLFGFALTIEGIYALAAFYFLAVEYSAPPLRFKTTPFLDSVSNGLYVLPGVVAYIPIVQSQPPATANRGGDSPAMAM